MIDFDVDQAMKVVGSSIPLFHEMDVLPEDFLDQAEEDLERGGDAAFLNAVTNAKRAIHAQVDYTLACVGVSHARAGRGKMELFASLGFVAPRVLRRVTDVRNVLEHEYRRPSPEQVLEAVDLAALFVEAAGRHLRSFDDCFSIGNADPVTYNLGSHQIGFNFNPERKTFEISVDREHELLGEVAIGSDDPLYLHCIRLSTAGDRPSKIDRAIRGFINAVSAGAA